MTAPVARRMWKLLEPLHAVTYFAAEAQKAFKEAGLKGFWMGYFGGRAAPMGPVGPAVVEAAFYNFSPVLVRRAIPDAWAFAAPGALLEARCRGAHAALRAVLGGDDGAVSVDSALVLARRALEALCVAGRPLAAANLDLALGDPPLAALWQAATTLREHRGDGHVASLVASELDGLEAHVTLVATGAVPRAVLQAARGWSDDEWSAAELRLVERGLLEPRGTLTTAGRELRRAVEADTDRLASAPWRRLGEAGTEALAVALAPLADAVTSSGIVPPLNPMGLPADATTRPPARPGS